jgi:hypothetical protein
MVAERLTSLGRQFANLKKYFAWLPMEGLAMHVRTLLIASLAAILALPLPAQPVKPAAAPAAAQPAPQRPAQVVLASAEQAQPAVAPSDQAPAPVKRRAARVTSCRCGDQAAETPDDQ